MRKFTVNYRRSLPEAGSKAFKSHSCLLHVNQSAVVICSFKPSQGSINEPKVPQSVISLGNNGFISHLKYSKLSSYPLCSFLFCMFAWVFLLVSFLFFAWEDF